MFRILQLVGLFREAEPLDTAEALDAALFNSVASRPASDWDSLPSITERFFKAATRGDCEEIQYNIHEWYPFAIHQKFNGKMIFEHLLSFPLGLTRVDGSDVEFSKNHIEVILFLRANGVAPITVAQAKAADEASYKDVFTNRRDMDNCVAVMLMTGQYQYPAEFSGIQADENFSIRGVLNRLAFYQQAYRDRSSFVYQEPAPENDSDSDHDSDIQVRRVTRCA